MKPHHVKSQTLVAIILIFLMVAQSCVKETLNLDNFSTKAELNPSVAMKVASGSFSLADAVEPDDTLVFHPNNTISLIIREDSLVYESLVDFIDIPATLPESGPISESFVVGDLDIADFSDTETVTLDQIANALSEPERSLIIGLDGTTNPFPPVNPPQAGGSYSADPFPNFVSVSFSSGTVSVTITNNLPVEIDPLVIRIIDSGASQVGILNYSNIPANGGSQSQNIDLSGTGPFTNQFTAEITSIGTPGSLTPVLISLADNITMDIVGQNIEISSGTAVLPDQMFTTDSSRVDLVLDPERVYKLKLQSGSIDYTVTSNILENIAVIITLPGSELGGSSPAQFTEIISYNGGLPTSGSIDLSGVTADLTTDAAQPYNIFIFQYELDIRSSNNLVTFDATQDLDFEFSVGNIALEYAEGFLGSRLETFEGDTIEIDDEVLDRITGTFELADPRVKFIYTNSVGIPIDLDLNLVGEFADASTIDLGASTATISSPVDTNNLFITDSLEYNKDNTNIEQLLVFPPPRKITYSGSANINPANDPGITNFVTNRSSFLLDLEIEIPFDFKASNLSLADSVDVDISADDFDPDYLEFSKLYINVQNYFPLDLEFELTPLDTVNMVTFDPLSFKLLAAADVNGQGIVEEVKRHNEVIDIDGQFFQDIIDAHQMIIKVTLNTSQSGAVPVKILTTYSLDFQLGIQAEFSYPIDF